MDIPNHIFLYYPFTHAYQEPTDDFVPAYLQELQNVEAEEQPRNKAAEDFKGAFGNILGAASDKMLEHLDRFPGAAVWFAAFTKEEPGSTAFGYAPTDFMDINVDLGSMDHVRETVGKLQDHGHPVFIDLVFNHTGEMHPWFQASRDPNHQDHKQYKDFYVWADPLTSNTDLPGKFNKPLDFLEISSATELHYTITLKNEDLRDRLDSGGNPIVEKILPVIVPDQDNPGKWRIVTDDNGNILYNPNNHIGFNGKITEDGVGHFQPAWHYDATRKQLYFGEFGNGDMPSLNVGNPAVNEELYKIVDFWTKPKEDGGMGIDGIRFDALTHIGASAILSSSLSPEEIAALTCNRVPDPDLRVDLNDFFSGYQQQEHQHDIKQPAGKQFFEGLRQRFPEQIILGELGKLGVEYGAALTNEGTIDLAYTSAFAQLPGYSEIVPFIKETLDTYPNGQGICWTTTTHDTRCLDALGLNTPAQLRAFNALLNVLPGASLSMLRDELGVPTPTSPEVMNPAKDVRNLLKWFPNPGAGAVVQNHDTARAPLPLTGDEPDSRYLKIPESWRRLAADKQVGNPQSVLNGWIQSYDYRCNSPICTSAGRVEFADLPDDTGYDGVVLLRRYNEDGSDSIIFATNYGAEPAVLTPNMLQQLADEGSGVTLTANVAVSPGDVLLITKQGIQQIADYELPSKDSTQER